MSLFGSSQFGLPRLKPLSSKRNHVVSVLDIGSTKVVCMIGRLTPRQESEVLPGRTHKVDVIGIGHQRSRGVKSGVIADLDALEGVIRLAVDAAERMAGLTVDSLIVNVSAGRLASDIYTASIDLGGQEVEAGDLRKVLIAASQQSLRQDRAILHSLPTGYSLDGERGIRDPLSMYGDLLGVDMHVVTAERTALKNLELCINRAHLSVEGIVATPMPAVLRHLWMTKSNSDVLPSTWAAAPRRFRFLPKVAWFTPMLSVLAVITSPPTSHVVFPRASRMPSV